MQSHQIINRIWKPKP